MARRALLVGIDEYDHFNGLTGCVADALAMQQVIERNADRSPNYSCRTMVYGQEHKAQKITRKLLKEVCLELFDFTGDVLMYFSGHGALTEVGGYLSTCDADVGDWGVSMQEIIQLATGSRARDILFILDCCHSGDIANAPFFNASGRSNPLAVLRENMTVIAASRASESAVESGGHGLFTGAVLDAMNGGAADHMGWVTAQSIYAFVERGFGGWVQRPVYKSHATQLTVVRQCAPLIERLKLQHLKDYFPDPDFKYQLDPEYETHDEHGNPRQSLVTSKVAIANLFKDFRDVGLLRATIEGEQFFWASLRGHTVELTTRGREYWRLIEKGLI